VTPHFDQVIRQLKKLPGLGHRSAERLALHLFVEKPSALGPLLELMNEAGNHLRACQSCGNLAEEEVCSICANPKRDPAVLCVVESVPDLISLERSAAFEGRYHVLQGKLSPVHGVRVEDLRFEELVDRIEVDGVREIILAISNDIEGEATCHYIQDHLLKGREIEITRIGFGIPSGSGLTFADANTVKSALEGRRRL